MRRALRITLLCFAFLLCLSTVYWVQHNAPTQTPAPAAQTALFQGVTYQREVWDNPRPVVIHTVTVDSDTPGVRVLVTPGDSNRELPLDARTTSEFLEDFGVQIAVNGDFIDPFHSTSLFDYYPRSGDPVDVLGFAASEGVAYSPARSRAPTLYFTADNQADFFNPPGEVYHAVSGHPMLARNGSPVRLLNDTQLAPRTAVALNAAGTQLILLVVDGRQTGYSEGVTLAELAAIVIAHGGFTAMNLDGGGSTALVTAGANGQAIQLNIPIDKRIPGRERPVGNHLGIFALPLEASK